MVVSSFLSQYGIRISTKEFNSVSWDEFKSLLAGIAPDTVLGRIVEIRSETDREVIKKFTSDQKRIHDEWKEFKLSKLSKSQFEKEMKELEADIAALIGGGINVK